jgi:hypothetical protein
MHQPGIMLGTLKLNLRFQRAAAPLTLGTGRTTVGREHLVCSRTLPPSFGPRLRPTRAAARSDWTGQT